MFNYPNTKKLELTEDHFGTPVSDPYRWLEDVTDPDVNGWVDAQIEFTEKYLETQAQREKIAARLKALYDYPKYGTVKAVGDRLIYSYNTGLQPQSVYWIQEGPTGTPEVLLDPNALSEDGTVAVTLSTASHCHRYIALLQAASGSDWQHLKVLDLASKTLLMEDLTGVKFTHVAWYRDGFFYSRYELPQEGLALSAKNEDMRIYYHRLGRPQDEDVLIFEDTKYPLRYNTLYTSSDERYLILSISEGTYGNELRLMDLGQGHTPETGTFTTIIDGFDSESDFIGAFEDRIYFLTDRGASNRKVIAYHVPTATFEDLVGEGIHTLEGAWKFGNQLVLQYLKDVVTTLTLHHLDGTYLGTVEQPTLGSVYEVTGSDELEHLYTTFGSFISPIELQRIHRHTLKVESFKTASLPYDPTKYVTSQLFCNSPDGTKVPVFITHRKDLERNGKNPTLLYAYGGFNVSLPPAFNPSNMFLVEQGGIYAQANLRGGSEYGEQWHRDGMLFNKQNVFDDFIAVAEHLIEMNYTSPDYLAIQGGSNGGLLMGAVVNQRPDLWSAVFAQVGVMDMIRYHKFTIGWGWMVEYGNPEEEAHFHNIIRYSPLHNIEAKAYPRVMVLTADHDDRVVPAHSYKYIATLQEKNTSANPMLIRIDKNAGHGAGKSISKLMQEQTDKYTFWNALKL